MSDERPEDSGLFGKLPNSRPGVRSPRRAATELGSEPRRQAPKRPAARPKASTVRPGPTARPGSDPPRPQRAEAGPRKGSDPAAEREAEGAGLEELAWAGIAVTAEAATLGVRLVTRALDAARRATER